MSLIYFIIEIVNCFKWWNRAVDFLCPNSGAAFSKRAVVAKKSKVPPQTSILLSIRRRDKTLKLGKLSRDLVIGTKI